MAAPALSASVNRGFLKVGASAVVFVSLDIVPPRQARTNPVALVLAIDASASMTGAKLERALEAAREFSRAMGPRDAFGVVVFRDRARTVMPLTRKPDPEGVEEALGEIEAGGETNLEAGMRAAIREMTRAPIPAEAV